VHGAAAAGLGAYLGIVAWLAASTRASILCHIVNNLAAVLSLSWGVSTDVSSPWTMPAGFGVAGLCLAAVWRRAGSPPRRPRPRPRAQGSDRPGSPTPGG
jgi:hypothetical protein